LRGLKYATWEDDSKVFPAEGEEGGDTGLPPSSLGHKKFQNYRFDVDEFLKIMLDLEQEVRKDSRYQASVQSQHKDEL
jgi:protein O-GlcNAc transferase